MALVTRSTLLALFCFVYSSDAVSEGALRFVRDNVPTTTQAWSAGIVQVYVDGRWGNICYNEEDFGDNEADVICRQLGYYEHLQYSAAANAEYGRDNETTVLDRVTCNSGLYLALSQCTYVRSTSASISDCNDETDVVVTCHTDKIWDRYSTTGDIRLTDGSYSNEGLLEIYCNDEWGSVCDTTFGAEAALLSCEQLGYNDYAGYNHLSLTGNSSQKAWLNSALDDDCSLDYYYEISCPFCLTSCKSCPTEYEAVTGCGHELNYATLECRNDLTQDSVNTEFAEGNCDHSTGIDGSVIVIAIPVIIVLFLCCCLCALTMCIRCCTGSGKGAEAHTSRNYARSDQPFLIQDIS